MVQACGGQIPFGRLLQLASADEHARSDVGLEQQQDSSAKKGMVQST
jgi:hypothetical protein